MHSLNKLLYILKPDRIIKVIMYLTDPRLKTRKSNEDSAMFLDILIIVLITTINLL